MLALPKAVAPATTAGNEFIQAIPVTETARGATGAQPPTAAARHMYPIHRLVSPAASSCQGAGMIREQDNHIGSIRRPGNRAMSNHPAGSGRRSTAAPPAEYSAPPLPRPSPLLKNSAIAAAIQREREAMLAPTGNPIGNGGIAIAIVSASGSSEYGAQTSVADCGARGRFTRRAAIGRGNSEPRWKRLFLDGVLRRRTTITTGRICRLEKKRSSYRRDRRRRTITCARREVRPRDV